MTECLIFDLDGTLWDPIDVCVMAWNSVIEKSHNSKIGTVCRADFLASMGKNHKEILELYFTSISIPERETLLRDCYEAVIPHIWKQKPKLYPGVASGLPALKEKYRLGLVSNCQSEYLRAFLSIYEFGDLFEVTLCYEQTGLTKAENISRAMSEIRAKSATYIGDTSGDQIAAENAGVPFCYAAYGFGKAEAYDLRFESFEEIANHFIEVS